MKQNLQLNEEGSAGGLFGMVFVLIIFGIIAAIAGKVIDVMVKVNNAMVISGVPMSQDSVNTMSTLCYIVSAMSFIFLIFVMINYWVNASNESSGEV